VLAYYDEQAGKWVELSSTVDATANVVTASVPHFTTFALIGNTKPAAFTLTLESISPAEVTPGEKVTITASVTNKGGRDGSYTVALEINGVKEAEKVVAVKAGAHELVTFTISKDKPGKYTVSVGGLGGSFTVVAPSPPVTPPPPVKPPFNWPLVGGIVGGVVVIGLIIFFVVRRRAD
jgi:hypothetical protein